MQVTASCKAVALMRCQRPCVCSQVQHQRLALLGGLALRLQHCLGMCTWSGQSQPTS